ncbi:MAG: hypothetical protein ACXABY_24555 [Candidatus Thorarchaeota archaeon]
MGKINRVTHGQYFGSYIKLEHPCSECGIGTMIIMSKDTTMEALDKEMLIPLQCSHCDKRTEFLNSILTLEMVREIDKELSSNE